MWVVLKYTVFIMIYSVRDIAPASGMTVFCDLVSCALCLCASSLWYRSVIVPVNVNPNGATCGEIPAGYPPSLYESDRSSCPFLKLTLVWAR
jgi:hypothetical protein